MIRPDQPIILFIKTELVVVELARNNGKRALTLLQNQLCYLRLNHST